MIRNLLIATCVVACTCLIAAPASAQLGQGNAPNVLFSQYSTPAGPSTTTAGMYPAPYNTLQLGSQAYYTYQPLMPHEMMYQHSRNYYNYYNSGGYYGDCNDSLNKTTVRWMSGTNHMGNLPWGLHCGGLRYRHQARHYGLNKNCGGDCGGDCDGDCGGRKRHFKHHRLRGGNGCASGNCGNAGCTTCASNTFNSGIINR